MTLKRFASIRQSEMMPIRKSHLIDEYVDFFDEYELDLKDIETNHSSYDIIPVIDGDTKMKNRFEK